ncbi:MAG: molybdenum cofactor biosynthesis protein MoaE [Firmicutes bacterium]|nr:molybdenum cofactor biosynthesis protein MoaE [Bacillota bacterium]
MKQKPSMDKWLEEAKAHESASKCGMYLTHNGVVRETAKAKVRQGVSDTKPIRAVEFSYYAAKVDAAIAKAYQMEGIYYIKVWLNEGEVPVGGDLMYVLIGGDIRPHVIDCLQALVGEIKNNCVIEKEIEED